MTGTLVNAAAIAVGGLLGLLLKRGISLRVEQISRQLVGLGVIIIGLNGVLAAMIRVDPVTGRLSDTGGILLVLSLVIGGLAGEWMRLDDRIMSLGQAIERRLGAEGFAKGFISATLLFCIGAMAIVGGINDGLGDPKVLLTKSALDGIMSIVLGSSLGIGVPFAAIPVLLYQGAIALCAGFLAPVLVGTPLLDSICMVGYCIVIVIGANQFDMIRLKTANLLPALLIPVLYNLLLMLKNTW